MDSILAQCHVLFQALNMTSLLSSTLFTIVFCPQEDNGSKETLVYRRNSWRSAQFSFTSACLHVTLLARVGWRVDRRDADSFSIWKESCPERGGVVEGNDIIHLEFICYSPEKKRVRETNITDWYLV